MNHAAYPFLLNLINDWAVAPFGRLAVLCRLPPVSSEVSVDGETIQLEISACWAGSGHSLIRLMGSAYGPSTRVTHRIDESITIPAPPEYLSNLRSGNEQSDAADKDVEYAMDLLLSDDGNALEAERLLLIAAESGSGIAAHNLGTLYVTGAYGVPAIPAMSRHWYERAFESGFEAKVATDPEWFRSAR